MEPTNELLKCKLVYPTTERAWRHLRTTPNIGKSAEKFVYLDEGRLYSYDIECEVPYYVLNVYDTRPQTECHSTHREPNKYSAPTLINVLYMQHRQQKCTVFGLYDVELHNNNYSTQNTSRLCLWLRRIRYLIWRKRCMKH